MNNKDIDTIFNNAKQFSLSQDEKVSLLGRVFDAPHTKLVRNQVPSRLYTTGGVRSLIEYYSNVSFARSRVLSSLLITTALLGTTGVMAQIALPGDILYPVKINVNEKLQFLATRTPEAKAVLEATFATRRLEEAHVLLGANKLNVTESQALATQFETHTTNLEKQLVELRKQGFTKEASSINASFIASVKVEQEALSTLIQASSTTTTLEVAKINDATNATSSTMAIVASKSAMKEEGKKASSLRIANATASTTEKDDRKVEQKLSGLQKFTNFISTLYATTSASSTLSKTKDGKKNEKNEATATASTTLYAKTAATSTAQLGGIATGTTATSSAAKATAMSATDIIMTSLLKNLRATSSSTTTLQSTTTSSTKDMPVNKGTTTEALGQASTTGGVHGIVSIPQTTVR